MGILSTIWFLVRVIPKPSRAGYPCMRAAFPIMTGFIVWILGVTGSIVAIREAKKRIVAGKYMIAAAFIIAGLSFAVTSFVQHHKKALAAENYVDNSVFEPNQPIGVGHGSHPGRVVWVHDADATNEDAELSKDNYFFSAENNDQEVITAMLDDAIMMLGGEKSLRDSWDNLFENFNERKLGNRSAYSIGQTIFIKINEGTSSWGADDDLYPASWYNPSAETTPQSVYALLDHLVNTVGVAEDDIYVADPRSHVWQYTYEYCSAEFPDVNYGDKDASMESKGRTTLTENSEDIMFYSDNGETMEDAVSDKFFDEMTEADYLISLAALKAHARAGITLTTKNHFGSHNRDAASHLHPSLVAPENDTPLGTTVGYGKYRVFVDIMGHEKIGKNTLLFFVDGLWGGPEATVEPYKFTSEPFNNDWSSSFILSQDNVAIESVCFDILRYEYNDPTDLELYRPHMYGADDYLQQAADPANWPEGISYDPEGDGTPVTSLGIHEHWNVFPLRQYSRNLGLAKGIELITQPEELAYNFPFVARKVEDVPVFDGNSDDDIWTDATWYPIDHTWINWGEEIPSDDFTGKFKVTWNEEDNLMYMFVEITDDAFIDGYVYPEGGYPNYDIVEVFIDEDRSGGLHVFDNSGDTWGYNAENAFSYHIAVDAPADGETVSSKVVADIKGTTWGDIANYADHFPDFIMKKSGNQYFYEFSMKVFSDEYDPYDQEASRVNLSTGKIMGLSVAYCDNDSDDGERDNFFGSVWVTEEAYNDHWMLCDDYGKLALGDVDGSVPVDVEVNYPPVAISEISDYQISELGENEVVVEDVTTLFSDADGDALTYTVDDDEDLLSSHFFGNKLRVRGETGFTGPTTVTLTASDGINTTNISFNVSYIPAGVNVNTIESSLKLYPIPVTNDLNLEFSHPENGNVNIRVLNMNGQVVLSYSDYKSPGTYTTKLNLEEFNNGLYLVEIKFQDETITQRINK